jgi:hypothetical protein
MFGIHDPQIWFAYVLALGFALACVAYGLLKWNDGGDEMHGG